MRTYPLFILGSSEKKNQFRILKVPQGLKTFPLGQTCPLETLRGARQVGRQGASPVNVQIFFSSSRRFRWSTTKKTKPAKINKQSQQPAKINKQPAAFAFFAS